MSKRNEKLSGIMSDAKVSIISRPVVILMLILEHLLALNPNKMGGIRIFFYDIAFSCTTPAARKCYEKQEKSSFSISVGKIGIFGLKIHHCEGVSPALTMCH